MQNNILDFENHIKVLKGYLIIPNLNEFISLPDDIVNRARSVIYFAVKIGGPVEFYFVDQSTYKSMMLRAALGEFVSLEEHIKSNYENDFDVTYEFCKMKDPIYHMLRLIRNFNYHIGIHNTDEKDVAVSTMFDPDLITTIQVPYISNLQLSDIEKLKGSKKYTKDVLLKMIECFDAEQKVLGITTLLINCVIHYLEILAGKQSST